MIQPPPQTTLENRTIWSRWFYSVYELITLLFTNRAFPSMTSTERDALTSPDNGTIIYNSTTSKIQGRAGGAWVDLH